MFIEALKNNDLEQLKKLPKGEYHNHCGLGLRFDVFNNYANGRVKKANLPLDGLKGLDEYIFGELVQFVEGRSGSEFLFEECIKEAISDKVTILEASIDCHEIMTFGDDLFNYIDGLKKKYKEQIDFRPEIGIAKTCKEASFRDYYLPCIDSGVYNSIDLYGQEEVKDFYLFKEYYDYAKQKGIKLKVHAGEFHGADNVKDAIEILNPHEIQHGIGAKQDDYVLDMIKERDIRLNICPSSNLLLGRIDDIKQHPIRKIYDKGIRISINTDDLLIFDSGVSEEYLKLYNAGVFTAEELDDIRKSTLK